MPTIKVTFRKDGTVEVMPEGYAGASCVDATAALEKALGKTQSSTPTGEMFAEAISYENQDQ